MQRFVKITLTMIILIQLIDGECWPQNETIAIQAARERQPLMRELVGELMGARLSPVFKSIEEAKAWGVEHRQDDAAIKEVFKLACEYKTMVMVFGMNNTFDNQLNNYLYYKAAWESARGIGARLSKRFLDIAIVDATNGDSVISLREFFMKRFQNIELIGFSDGRYFEDEEEMIEEERRRWVNGAYEKLLDQTQHDQNALIVYADFKRPGFQLTDSTKHSFDIVFIQHVDSRMVMHYVENVGTELLKDGGFLCLRFKENIDHEITDQVLKQWLLDRDYSMRMVFSDLPKEEGLEDFCYVIQRAWFATEGKAMTFGEIVESHFKGEAAARLAA